MKYKLTRFFALLLAVLIFCSTAAFAAKYEDGRFTDRNDGASEQRGFSSMDEPKLRRDEKRSITSDVSTMRVLITIGNVSSITLNLHGCYYIEENMRPVVGTEASPLSLTIRVSNDQVSVISGSSTLYSGSVATITRVNLNSHAGYAELRTNGNDSNDGRSYLGNFRFSSNENDTVRMVNVIPTAHYLYGIVPYEMSESSQIEALKCQAVAAKSYALGFSYAGNDFDITDSFNYQGYRGYVPGYTKCMRACIDVCGKALAMDDEILMTFYAASNGGETTLPSYIFGSSSIDYAYSVKLDDIDFEYVTNKRETLEIQYGEAPSNANFNELLEDLARNQLGYSVSIDSILEADVNTPKFPDCQRDMTRMDVRMIVRAANDATAEISVRFNPTQLKAYGVFSRPYRIYWGEATEAGYNVYFCRWGHGIGLSQYGAQGRAQLGHTYEQILEFYFDKMNLVDVHEDNPESPYAYTQQVVAYGVIGSTTVNMRSGPSTSYSAIGSFSRGTHVNVVSETEDWLICIVDGKLGYIRGDLVDIVLFPSPEGAQQPIGNAIVTTETTAMSGPSSYCDPTAVYAQNTRLLVWHEIGNWYHVEKDGFFCFIEKSSVNVSTWFVLDLHAILSSSQIAHPISPKP